LRVLELKTAAKVEWRKGTLFRRFVSELTPEQKSVVGEAMQHLRIDMSGVFSYWIVK